jgi:urea transport system ATP-binding protein
MFERKGGDLSGGQQQQLAIARALVAKPELLLLDEPTEGIQPSVVQNIRDVIRGIKRGGRTAILLVEQSIDFVKSVADHYYVMDRGAIVASGPIGQLDEAAVRNFLSV